MNCKNNQTNEDIIKLSPKSKKILDKVFQRYNSISKNTIQRKELLLIFAVVLLAEKLCADISIETVDANETNSIYGVITFQSDMYFFYQMNSSHKMKVHLKQLIDFADDILIEMCDDSSDNKNKMINLIFTFSFFEEIESRQ